ncbi:glycosyltransferase, partial [Nocardiopsis flavescens]
HFTVDPLPEVLGLGAVAGVERVPVRYVPYNGAAVVPEWVHRGPDGRPVRLCVDLGAHPERMGGFAVPVDEVVAAMGRVDAEVLVRLPARSVSGLTELPGNVRLVEPGELPLHVLLPECEALIGHGAPDAVMTAVAAGIPQGFLPQKYYLDAPLLAERLVALGAGVRGDETAPSDGDALVAMAEALLGDAGLREGAAAARALVEAEPTPVALVAEIEALVEKHRTAAP